LSLEHMTTPSRWTGIRFALRRRNYRLFVAGQLVSLLGTWTRSVAQGWLVFRLTESAVWLGVIAAASRAAPGIPLATGGVVCVLAALRFMRQSRMTRAEPT
jgi:hypothetical protein